MAHKIGALELELRSEPVYRFPTIGRCSSPRRPGVDDQTSKWHRALNLARIYCQFREPACKGSHPSLKRHGTTTSCVSTRGRFHNRYKEERVSVQGYCIPFTVCRKTRHCRYLSASLWATVIVASTQRTDASEAVASSCLAHTKQEFPLRRQLLPLS